LLVLIKMKNKALKPRWQAKYYYSNSSSHLWKIHKGKTFLSYGHNPRWLDRGDNFTHESLINNNWHCMNANELKTLYPKVPL